MQIGFCGKPIDARIDIDDLSAALHDIDQPMSIHAIRIGNQGIIAPKNYSVWAFPIYIVIAIRELLRIVSNPKTAGRSHATEYTRCVACFTGHRKHRIR